MNNFLQYMTVVLLLLVITEVAWLSRPKKRRQMEQISTLVDTSVLMDGRVIDLARTGFLLGQIIVPKSVLSELQLLADGGHLRFDLTIYSKCHIGIHIIDLLALQLYYISCANATSRMLN